MLAYNERANQLFKERVNFLKSESQAMITKPNVLGWYLLYPTHYPNSTFSVDCGYVFVHEFVPRVFATREVFSFCPFRDEVNAGFL